MKKIATLIISVVLSFTFFSVSHAVSDDNWDIGPLLCPANELTTLSQAKFDSTVDAGDYSKLIAGSGNWCQESAAVGTTMIRFTDPPLGSSVNFCGPGYWGAKAPDSSYLGSNILGVGRCIALWYTINPTWCCPQGEYEFKFRGIYDYCATLDNISKACLGGYEPTSDPSFSQVVRPTSQGWFYGSNNNSYILKSGSYYNAPTVPSYICQAAHCVTSTGETLAPQYYKVNVSEDVRTNQGLSCVNNGDPVKAAGNTCGSGSSMLCFYGGAIDSSVYDKVKDDPTAAGQLISCGSEPPDQVCGCEACFANNYDKSITAQNISPFVWSSSLGCVDTRSSPFVTRIIQIGLGLASGIALLRIIQGAFMRQTNDPSKIQEGNEIIISTILAIVVLAGAITILQIIGVDLLGLITDPSVFSKILG